MPGDLGLDALSPELIGDAVEARGEYAEPATQQNHMRPGREGAGAPQQDQRYDGPDKARANPYRETATLFARTDRPIFSFAPVFSSASRRYRRHCS
jgi:hypothetical protein